jgi:hypothetical protein
LVETVVVGNVTVEDSNEVPQVVIPTAAVPVMEIHNFCPFVGVPDKFVEKFVIVAD